VLRTTPARLGWRARLREDVDAAVARDPAVHSRAEVVLGYPGLHAIWAYRLHHALWTRGHRLVARMISQGTRAATGVEIHPGATIGRRFFIDHGMGVVIGETAELGDDVTLYQGVTLGGTGFATGKRHPTVQDNVTIGSGAKLLGPITVGHGSKIGANSVVIHDVPANSTVVGNPGHPVRIEGRRPEGPDADWVHLPDPIADAIKSLASRISALEETTDEAGEGNVRPLRPAAPRSEGENSAADSAHRVNRSVGPNPAGG
jgi:serine O-acetyltransferase